MAESKRGPGRPPGSKNKTTKNNTGAATSKAKAKAQEIQAKKKADQRVMDEIWSIITIAIGAFLGIATMTNGAGAFGNMVGAALRGVFAHMAYVLPFYLILFGVLLFARKTSHFSLRTFLLLLVILLQLVVIVFFAYFGNYIYFSLEPPEKCCVISSSRQSLGNIIPKVDRFRKQYELDEIVRYDDPHVLDVIARNDTVFLYDVPIKERIHLIEYCYQKQKNIYYNFEMIDVVSQVRYPG